MKSESSDESVDENVDENSLSEVGSSEENDHVEILSEMEDFIAPDDDESDSSKSEAEEISNSSEEESDEDSEEVSESAEEEEDDSEEQSESPKEEKEMKKTKSEEPSSKKRSHSPEPQSCLKKKKVDVIDLENEGLDVSNIITTSGRPKRQTKAPERYMDKRFVQFMLKDVPEKEIAAITDETDPFFDEVFHDDGTISGTSDSEDNMEENVDTSDYEENIGGDKVPRKKKTSPEGPAPTPAVVVDVTLEDEKDNVFDMLKKKKAKPEPTVQAVDPTPTLLVDSTPVFSLVDSAPSLVDSTLVNSTLVTTPTPTLPIEVSNPTVPRVSNPSTPLVISNNPHASVVADYPPLPIEALAQLTVQK